MESGGEWGCSRRRRRRRRRAEEPEGSLSAGLQRRRLQEACSELRSSEFWDSHLRALFTSLQKHFAAGQQPAEPAVERALAALEKLQLAAPGPEPQPPVLQEAPGGARGLRCVCYGIGSFSTCVRARYQLSLLLLLLQDLEIPHGQCCVYDPVFSVLEIEVLRDLGLTVLQENEEGKRPIHEPTIFCMIHCGKALYNNLLWSNWSVEALSKMAIIGNSFQGIQERVPSRIFHKDYGYIAKVLAATAEEAFPPSQQYPDVFNDTSLHCFPLRKLRGLPPETWKLHEEPAYSDEDQLEIIRSTR